MTETPDRERGERDREHLLIPDDRDVLAGDPRDEPTKFGEHQDDGADLTPTDDDNPPGE